MGVPHSVMLDSSCCASDTNVLASCNMFPMQVLSKGVPEDAMPGIKDKQVPLPDSLNNFNGLYNSQGSKVSQATVSQYLQGPVKSESQQLALGQSAVAKLCCFAILGICSCDLLMLML